nr:diguanylate cyclase [Pseudochelatococcus contaminans]
MILAELACSDAIVPQPKILVIDDIKANLVAMRRVLGSMSATIYEASSGNEALALCLDHDFALILLDAHMPDMDGFEVARLLADDPKTCSIPVIFVTAAYLDDLNRLKGYTFGAVDYIAKPINDAVLLSKVTVFLDLHVSKLRLTAALQELEKRTRQLEEEIHERKRIEKQIRHMAMHDALTGLGNRMLFLDQLSREASFATRHGSMFALLYIDIDGFKQVNDNFGHVVGDRLLAAIATRLRSAIRHEDVAVRLGGDEFAVIMSPVSGSEAAQQKAQMIVACINEPFSLAFNDAQATVTISASIGIALFPTDTEDTDELIRLTDQAMYAVKKSGKSGTLLVSDLAAGV